MDSASPHFIDGPHGRLAYRRRQGAAPGVVWLGGFRSDMLGTKAAFLDEWARQQGRAFLRFDYSGHGESAGRFEDGSIGDWADDALAVFDALAGGPQILVGSSMGAWIATLLAKQRVESIAAVIFIAPAPDFTERLMWPSFSEEQRETIMREGRLEQPSDYSDEPEIITQKLIEDGRQRLVMDGPVTIDVPVRILQGMADDAVPWRHALAFAELIKSDDVEITLTKSGDHRLSSPTDLSRLTATLERLCRT
jgi:pimeloyl-ACP methyl ester carboxylesterase